MLIQVKADPSRAFYAGIESEEATRRKFDAIVELIERLRDRYPEAHPLLPGYGEDRGAIVNA